MKRSLPNTIADAILQEYIRGRNLVPGDKLPSVKELQERYGVANGTILNALGVLQTQGIVEKRHGSGCYITEAANVTRNNAPALIGFMASSFGSEFPVRIRTGVDNVCRKHGYHMVVSSGYPSYEVEREEVARMVDAGCRAIIMQPFVRTRRLLRKDYLRTEFRDIPIVLIDIAYPEQERSIVTFDNYRAGYDMTQLLLREGHKRIAFWDVNVSEGDLMHRSVRERYRGYIDALESADIKPRPQDRWLWSHYMELNHLLMIDEFARRLHRWKQQKDRPTALIAHEDLTAMKLISIAREIDIDVPNDLQIVGFDNHSSARSFSPMFTTTDPDLERAGEIAAETALREIVNPSLAPVVYLLEAPVLPRSASMVSERILAAINKDMEQEPADLEGGGN